MPSNILPLHLKQTFLPIIWIWIFTEGEGDEIEYRLPCKIISTLIITVWFFRSHAWFWSCSFFGSLLDILAHFDSCLQWFATILWVQTRSTRWRSTFDRRNWRYDWWLLGPIAPRWPCRTKVKKLYTITIVFPITQAICNRCCTTKKVVAKCISWRFLFFSQSTKQ